MTVRVEADKPVFVDPLPKVEFGRESAQVQQVLSATNVQVLVPNIPPGEAEVRIQEALKAPGKSATVRVLKAPTKKLVLELSGANIRLLSASERGGEYTNTPEQDQRRLSFDVLTADGNLLYTGAIVHPTLGRMEVFDEPQPEKKAMHNEPAMGAAVFELKIPNISGEVVIKFYDVPQGADLSTPEGRAARRYVNQVTVK
jgi:hypothetical protein